MSAHSLLDLIWLVPAFPLFGAVVLLLGGTRIGEPRSGWFATLMLALSFVWSVVSFFALHSLPAEHREQVATLFRWIPAGGLQVNLGFLADPLSVTFILFVTGVATLIHLFSVGYMHGDERYPRFFGYLNLFVAAMLILVLGSSFLVTFLGWEGVGLCSYLLVSFWFERNAAANAGKKAFITTRVGDVGFMIGMFLIFQKLGTLDYAGAHGALLGASGLAKGTATAIALALFLGAVGKSAQFPLHVWLPDAMEGPTPVSALIHAATMVTAGVFLVARAHPFFEASGDAMTVVAWIGAGTALGAGFVALVQPDIKRVLAYSTVSQLGYMFLALGVGAYASAIFLVIVHAFFKGALFLGSASVIHGNEGNQDMRRMGRFAKYMPITASAFVVAWLAIAGLPPFSGFFAKDDVLAKAFFSHHYGVWVVGLAAALLTGAYMTRQVLLVFFGNERWAVRHTSDDGHNATVAHGEVKTTTPTVAYGDPVAPGELAHRPHESPPVMTLPVLALAGLAVIGGLLNLPFKGVEFLTDWLEPTFARVHEIHATSFGAGALLSLLTVTLGVAGIAVAFRWYGLGVPDPEVDPFDEALGPVGAVAGRAFFFDETIERLVDGPGKTGARWLADVFDARVIDGAVNGLGALVRRGGSGLRRLQTGLVRNYALGLFAGAAALVTYLLVWAAR